MFPGTMAQKEITNYPLRDTYAIDDTRPVYMNKANISDTTISVVQGWQCRQNDHTKLPRRHPRTYKGGRSRRQRPGSYLHSHEEQCGLAPGEVLRHKLEL